MLPNAVLFLKFHDKPRREQIEEMEQRLLSMLRRDVFDIQVDKPRFINVMEKKGVLKVKGTETVAEVCLTVPYYGYGVLAAGDWRIGTLLCWLAINHPEVELWYGYDEYAGDSFIPRVTKVDFYGALWMLTSALATGNNLDPERLRVISQGVRKMAIRCYQANTVRGVQGSPSDDKTESLISREPRRIFDHVNPPNGL